MYLVLLPKVGKRKLHTAPFCCCCVSRHSATRMALNGGNWLELGPTRSTARSRSGISTNLVSTEVLQHPVWFYSIPCGLAASHAVSPYTAVTLNDQRFLCRGDQQELVVLSASHARPVCCADRQLCGRCRAFASVSQAWAMQRSCASRWCFRISTRLPSLH